jgi:hypothetical protein
MWCSRLGGYGVVRYGGVEREKKGSERVGKKGEGGLSLMRVLGVMVGIG